VRDSINKLTENRAYLRLDDYEAEFNRLYADTRSAIERGDREKPDKETLGRYYNDSACRRNLLRFPMRDEGHGLYSFIPAWDATSTGRLKTVDGGCLLSSSRALKGAAYPESSFRNFDVKACQVFIAARLIERVGLDATPLREYLAIDNPKEIYARALGLVGSYAGRDAKQIVLCLVMIAHLPKDARDWRRRVELTKAGKPGGNSILEILSRYADDSDSKMTELIERAWDVLGQIQECMRQWERHLLYSYIPDKRDWSRGGYVLKNAVVMPLRASDLKLPAEISIVQAHLLQGFEQACVQQQIVCDEDCLVVAYEHDGFVVSEGMPDMNLWTDITARHDLAGMRLEQKAIA
jgi:hypothetical protein